MKKEIIEFLIILAIAIVGFSIIMFIFGDQETIKQIFTNPLLYIASLFTTILAMIKSRIGN